MKYLLFFLSILCLSSCDKASSYSKIENPASSQTDSISISEKYYQEGIKHYENNDLEKAKESYKKAISNCTSQDADTQFRYYLKLLDIYIPQNEYGDALAALTEYHEKNLFPETQKKLNVLSTEQSIYSIMNDFEKALITNQKLYDLSILVNDINMENQSLIARVNLLRNLGQEINLEKLIDELLEKDNLSLKQKTNIIIEKGILAFYQNDFKTAIENYEYSLSLNKSSDIDGRDNSIAIDYANIAEAYIELGKYEKAQIYLDSFHAIEFNKVNNDIRRSVFKYELRLARYLNSDSKRIDSIIDKTAKEQDAFYKRRFNKELESLTEEKQKSEQLLKEKQQIEIDKLNFRNNALLIGSFLSIGLLGILFFTFKQKRDHEIANLKNQQRLLRAQMNPHFIFNVLSSIQNLVRTDANSAARFITKFSRLLRTVLENSMQNYVSLEDEVAVLKNYLDLQKLRFPDLFDYQLSIDEGIEESTIKIPPMLIQPFVENAIEHGFKGIESRGWIEIQLTNNSSKSNKVLNCKIMDNGTGYNLNKESSKKSASVKLISNFIKKATGSELSISFLDQDNKIGTVVEFQIPTN